MVGAAFNFMPIITGQNMSNTDIAKMIGMSLVACIVMNIIMAIIMKFIMPNSFKAQVEYGDNKTTKSIS